MTILWHPAYLKSSDSRTAHALKPGTIVPLCNIKPYSLGGGFATIEETGCMACGQCLRILRKLQSKSTTTRKTA